MSTPRPRTGPAGVGWSGRDVRRPGRRRAGLVGGPAELRVPLQRTALLVDDERTERAEGHQQSHPERLREGKCAVTPIFSNTT